MDLRVTFASIEDEALTPEDLAEIEHLFQGVDISTEPGGVGVGASGYGITVVLQVAERVINDFGSWVGLGLAVREMIKWRRVKSDRPATISDTGTMGVVAASAIPRSWVEDLSAADYLGAVPLFGRAAPGPNWVGTDERDMWVATFKRPGYGVFVYLSPSGAVLGYSRVPIQTFFDGTDWISRTPEKVAQLFADWNQLA